MSEMVPMLSVVISEVIVMDNAEISNMVGASNRVFKGSFDEKLKSNNFFIRNEVASYPNLAPAYFAKLYEHLPSLSSFQDGLVVLSSKLTEKEK